MPKKESLDIEELKDLCNRMDDILDCNKYVQKEGYDYIQALSKKFALQNKNDQPFTIDDIASQPTKAEFKFCGLDDFKYICELKAKPLEIINNCRVNEKIIASNFNPQLENVFFNSLGVAYLITCRLNQKEHIIKFGSSRTTFNKRLGSYNCGVVNNWRTASTTNIKMLQSLVTTRETFKLYILDCSDDPYILRWRGESSVPFASPKALAVEDIIIKKFKEQFGKLPLANVQGNATEL